LKSNIEALSIHLTDKQIEYLESVQDFQIGFPGNFIGDDPRAGPTAPIIAAAAPVAWAVSSHLCTVRQDCANLCSQKYGKPIGHD
jgi:hypothetical protein